MPSKSTKLFGELSQFLHEAQEYFEDRQDADVQDGQWVPNREMELNTRTIEAMSNLTALIGAVHEEELERLDRAFDKLSQPAALSEASNA